MTDPEPTGKSILDTAKKMLGIPSTDTSFDTDIIASINSAFMSLNQIGVVGSGTDTTFQIKDKDDTWEDFMTTNLDKFGGLETYLYLKARLSFDPPSTSFAISAVTDQITELEERFKLQAYLLVYVPPVPEEEEEFKMDIILNDSEKAKAELMHVGVLGMRWGHRKPGSSSNGGRTPRNRLERDFRSVRATETAVNRTKNFIKKHPMGEKTKDVLKLSALLGIAALGTIGSVKVGRFLQAKLDSAVYWLLIHDMANTIMPYIPRKP